MRRLILKCFLSYSYALDVNYKIVVQVAFQWCMLVLKCVYVLLFMYLFYLQFVYLSRLIMLFGFKHVSLENELQES